MNCQLLRQKFAELTALKLQLEQELAKSRRDGKARNLFALKRQIEEKLLDIKSQEGMESLRKELLGDINEQVKIAQEILGMRNVITPADASANFKIDLTKTEIPKIPFSKQELERSAELGRFLIFRPKGMTMRYMKEFLKDKKTDDDKPFFYDQDWHESNDEKHIFEEAMEGHWALVDKEPIKLKDKKTGEITVSTSKDYVQQSKILRDYLKQKYQDLEMPEKYQEAIQEFNEYLEKEFSGKTDDQINIIIRGTDWEKYAKELANLKLNDLTRQTPTEALFDIFSYYLKNKERIMENRYTCTKRQGSDGRLMCVGHFGSGGVSVDRWSPGYRSAHVGVSSSCS